MRALADWQPDATRLSVAEFCAIHIHPLLVHCRKSSPLRPVGITRGLTIDRVMVDAHPAKDMSTALADYAAEEVRSRHARSKSVEITLGCSHHCDIQINDASVSKLHALLYDDTAGWHIRDASSLTGIRINDLEPTAAPLRSGDRISVGVIDLIFLLPAEVYRLIRGLELSQNRHPR